MPRNLIDAVMFSDANQIKEMLSTLYEKDDLVYVNTKAEEAIKNNSIVPETSIEKSQEMPNNLKEKCGTILLYQKWFLLAKAILMVEDHVYKHVVMEKHNYKNLENESLIQNNIDKYKEYMKQFPDNQISEEEIRLNARAICLANYIANTERLRNDCEKEELFIELIDKARQKNKNFTDKTNNFIALNTLFDEEYSYFENLDGQTSLDSVEESIKTMRTKEQIDELKAINEERVQEAQHAENEFKEKKAISEMQKERDNRSPLWFIFRPISNLVNYIRLNMAKKHYKETYILPKFENYKYDKEDYKNKIENAVEMFEEEIVSENEIKISKNFKVLTEKDLEPVENNEIEIENSLVENEKNLEENLDSVFNNEKIEENNLNNNNLNNEVNKNNEELQPTNNEIVQ